MTKKHLIFINQPYYSQIQNWIKKVEIRTWKSYEKIKENDIIVFKNNDLFFEKKVLKIQKFHTIHECFGEIDYQICLPSISSLDWAIKVYLSIPNYAEKFSKYWLIAFIFH